MSDTQQKQPRESMTVVPPEMYRQSLINQAREQSVEDRLDYAPEGGRYLVDGVWRDANGLPCEAPKEAKDAEEAQLKADEERRYREHLDMARQGIFGPNAVEAGQLAVDADVNSAVMVEERRLRQAEVDEAARKAAAEQAKAAMEDNRANAEAQRKAIDARLKDRTGKTEAPAAEPAPVPVKNRP
jgi:hypothetical protein